MGSLVVQNAFVGMRVHHALFVHLLQQFHRMGIVGIGDVGETSFGIVAAEIPHHLFADGGSSVEVGRKLFQSLLAFLLKFRIRLFDGECKFGDEGVVTPRLPLDIFVVEGFLVFRNYPKDKEEAEENAEEIAEFLFHGSEI